MPGFISKDVSTTDSPSLYGLKVKNPPFLFVLINFLLKYMLFHVYMESVYIFFVSVKLHLKIGW